MMDSYMFYEYKNYYLLLSFTQRKEGRKEEGAIP